MSKITPVVIFLIVSCAYLALAGDTVRVDRHGRRVQVDGFLLEWDGAAAQRWGGSSWSWDAVNTVEGVAGYFALRTPPECASWVFTIAIPDTGKTFEMRIPEQAAGDFFAFDRSSYESENTYAAEWLIPWSAFGDGDIHIYTLVLNAASACVDESADTLPTTVLTIHRAPPPTGSSSAYIVMMVSVTILTVILMARRRRGRVPI